MKEIEKLWNIHGGVWREVAERSGGRRRCGFVWYRAVVNDQHEIIIDGVGGDKNVKHV